jgi:hypothetical protein
MNLLTSLSTVALALIVGMAGATAQTRAKKTTRADTPEARLKMCNDMIKGQYRSPHDDYAVIRGRCLANIPGWGPRPDNRRQAAAAPRRRSVYYYGAPSYYYGGYGSYGAYFGQPVGGGGGQMYAGGGYLGPSGYYRAQ